MASDSISVDDLQKALTQTAAALAQHQVNYALIGGLAASYRSQPRFTKDVDFLLHVPQVVLPRLLADLQQRGFAFDTEATIREWAQHSPNVRTVEKTERALSNSGSGRQAKNGTSARRRAGKGK
jgi:hypothetical protein